MCSDDGYNNVHFFFVISYFSGGFFFLFALKYSIYNTFRRVHSITFHKIRQFNYARLSHKRLWPNQIGFIVVTSTQTVVRCFKGIRRDIVTNVKMKKKIYETVRFFSLLISPCNIYVIPTSIFRLRKKEIIFSIIISCWIIPLEKSKLIFPHTGGLNRNKKCARGT